MLLVPTRGEQESEIKAQEPETERPKDQGKVKRTLNTAREALATEERAQQKTLAKLRSDKAKITALRKRRRRVREASQYLPLRLNLKQKRGCVDGSPIFCTSECSAGLTGFPDCAQGVEDDEFTVKGPEVLVLANQA